MPNVAKLKDQARAFEQKSQWREAVQAYTALMEQSAGDEVDLGIWNRIGDLHLRLNDTAAAVSAYERAADAYAEVGFHNNAIALCNKILRIAPDRVSVHLKLGRVSAAKGFWADARQSFLAYAERMQKRGDIDGSLDALKEFVDLFPDEDDTDVRLMLAEQLRAHGREEEAVHQLRVLLGQLPRHGREGDAPDIIALIQSIDAEAETTPLAAPTRADSEVLPSPGGVMGLERGAALEMPAPQDAPDTPSEEADLAPVEGFETTAQASADEPLETAASGSPDVMDEGLIEIEPTAFGDFEGAFDDLASEDEDGAEEEAEPLPLLGLELTGDEADGEDEQDDIHFVLPESLDEDAEEDDGEEMEPLTFLADPGPGYDTPLDEAPLDEAEPLPGLEVGASFDVEEADDEGLEPLPLLGAPAADQAEEEAPGEEGFETLHAEAQDEEEARVEDVETVHVGEQHEDVETVPASEQGEDRETVQVDEPDEDALRERIGELAAAGDYHGAVQAVRALRVLRPRDVLVGQKEVEFAFKTEDRQLLIDAYLALAEQFEAVGEPAKARAAYQRVVELDQGNPVALAGLAPPPPRPASPAEARPPAEPEGGYVDLGALILDDQVGGGEGTRFVVEEEEPSGDEDRDFAEMLARFRQKVSENIGSEDSASHYDLGLAFKEMGLLDEAISHFQIALQGGANPLATLEVMAECFVAKGQWAVAQRVLERALAIPGGEGDQIGVYYLLGRCMEARGDREAAASYYERVLSLDIGFRDAPRRVQQLRQGAH